MILMSSYVALALLLSTAVNSYAGNSYALIIGIDDYPAASWQSLGSAQNDGEALKQILTTKYSFSSVVTLYNGAATRVNIINELDKLSKTAKKDDNILIFYAGHGIEIGDEGYWVPSDAKGKERYELVANSEIKNVLSKTASRHVLLLVDACFSGSSFKSPSFFVNNDGTDAYYKKVGEMISRQAIVSGSLRPIADGGSSVFMKYTLKFLNNNAEPQLDAGELYDMLQFPIYANTPNMPRFGHIQNTGHEGGQFIFKTRNAKVSASDDDNKTNNPSGACDLEANINEGRNIKFRDTESKLTVRTNQAEANFQWYYNDEPTGINQPYIVADKEGIYKVVVATSATCKEEISAFVKLDLVLGDVYINEGSTVDFTMKGELNAVGPAAGTSGIGYEWRANGVLVSETQSLNVYNSGTYTVSLLKDGVVKSEATTNVTVKPRIYRTSSGDDVQTIAKKYYGDEAKDFIIYNANIGKIKRGEPLQAGITIEVPLEEAIKEKVKEKVAPTSIKIAGASQFAPFSAPGIYNDGIATEIIKETFKLVGQEVELDFLPLNQVKGATFNGKFAAAYPCQKSAIDEKVMLFSEPIYDVYNVFFSEKGAEIEFTSPKKLRGRTVAVVVGYNIDELKEFYQKGYIKIRPCRSLEEAFGLLKKGEVDLVATSQVAGYGLIGTSDEFSDEDFEVLPKAIGSSSLHLAVSKNHPLGERIIESFNAAFLQLKSSGKIDEIVDTHLDKFQNSKP